MKVILLEDIKGTGKKGDIINASDGHARNYLIPRGLAAEANQGNLDKLNFRKKRTEELRIEELEEARKLSNSIEQLKISIPVKIGDKGKLFGSVTNKEIADIISKEIGEEIDRRKIILEEPIKTIGTKKIIIKIHQDVNAKLDIEIIESK